MPIQIKIEQRGSSIETVRQRYYRILNRLSKPDVSRSVKKVAEIWAVNYRSEGKQVGGWAQLAQQTVADRAKRGYGGEHPIMIRQGSLYAMSTLFFMQGQQGSASATTRSSGNSVTTRANLSMANGVAILS